MSDFEAELIRENDKLRMANIKCAVKLTHYRAIEEAAWENIEFQVSLPSCDEECGYVEDGCPTECKYLRPKMLLSDWHTKRYNRPIENILNALVASEAHRMGYRDGWPEGETEYMVRRKSPNGIQLYKCPLGWDLGQAGGGYFLCDMTECPEEGFCPTGRAVIGQEDVLSDDFINGIATWNALVEPCMRFDPTPLMVRRKG